MQCGLDKGPKASKLAALDLQLEVFEAQLQLAQELQRPVSVSAAAPTAGGSGGHGSVPTVAERLLRVLSLPNLCFCIVKLTQCSTKCRCTACAPLAMCTRHC